MNAYGLCVGVYVLSYITCTLHDYSYQKYAQKYI